jgi:predicted Zn-dependent protease with MMP-like domain
MKREKFELLVEEALADIPPKFKQLLNNITVQVEDSPSPDVLHSLGRAPGSMILGIYHGVPFPHRGPYYGNLPPDIIVIYQHPIEKICYSEEEIKETIRKVVRHEIGHYFGFDDKQLRELEES